MAFLDKTTGANFIPELWANPIYAFYKETNRLANSVDDYSALVKGAASPSWGRTSSIKSIYCSVDITSTGFTI